MLSSSPPRLWLRSEGDSKTKIEPQAAMGSRKARRKKAIAGHTPDHPGDSLAYLLQPTKEIS
jgi:hypothetical protein